ncbi:FAD-binding oxidoreductase [Dokdonella fugitiva]|jgi:decaprenylphospho-beta-D-ribofuranose 2-oxidase|uniref:Decaprenylphospho-beta-D-ribofuranose 2-oxidase n=1 Tax=Dokdonella fugitiva TaxID=328517 RepID=A0A4R2IFP7_9GAMM|nr:FAD-binding oxidoreductase [Dokdonella fugitiva]TCO43046.1 decaprenylphospho-beta-D-ribofuranose 2-oxidase [Dokdonella fugitiva]
MRGLAVAQAELTSFDRQFHARCALQRPDRYRLLDALPVDAPRIARGGGVSYVGASFGDGVVSQSLDAFDRLLAFDAAAGRLTVEAGARIGDLQRFLLGRGWYLPVTPGHPRATVGGCIAADVHGKNPARDGTFRAWVDALVVHRPGEEPRVADRTHDADLFAATFAGFGLTGTISSATLRLARPPHALVLRRVPVASLAEAARVLREAANAPVLYGWHDGGAAHFGRGVVNIGLASSEDDEGAPRVPPASADLPAQVAPLPFPLWNRAGLGAANRWLDWRWRRAGQAPMALAEALFPLNRARLYFAGFGPAGMAEAQWLVPHPRFEAFAAGLAELVTRTRPRIALIASKLFAGVADGFSFDGSGIALAIQVASPGSPGERAFLEALAELAVAHDGRPNLIKDSTLDAGMARRAVSGFDAARARRARHDPHRLHGSELARRLAL